MHCCNWHHIDAVRGSLMSAESRQNSHHPSTSVWQHRTYAVVKRHETFGQGLVCWPASMWCGVMFSVLLCWLCCALLCFVVLCWLCCAVLCCVVLCCAVLCCVVLFVLCYFVLCGVKIISIARIVPCLTKKKIYPVCMDTFCTRDIRPRTPVSVFRTCHVVAA